MKIVSFTLKGGLVCVLSHEEVQAITGLADGADLPLNTELPLRNVDFPITVDEHGNVSGDVGGLFAKAAEPALDNLSFAQALELMKSGKKLTRPSFMEGSSIVFGPHRPHLTGMLQNGTNGRYQASSEDLHASDWKVLPDEALVVDQSSGLAGLRP